MSEPAVPPVRKREIFGWAMFDFANSSYTTIIVTTAFSLVFMNVIVGEESGGIFLWGLAISLSKLVVLSTAPIVGAIADGSGRKKPFLAVTWLGCVVATAALYFAVPGQLALAMGLFVASNVAFALGESLVAAFLPEISTSENVGRISGIGWGIGYFGGLGSLLLIAPLVTQGYTVENLDRLRLIGPVTALFFLVAGLPTFLFLRERAPRPEPFRLGFYARTGFRRLGSTVRSLRHFRELAKFFGVFSVFMMGMNSVISFATKYAEGPMGFTPGEIIAMFIALQLAAAAGAVAGGRIQDRWGSRRSLQMSLSLWTLVCIGAILAPSKAVFFGVAVGAGIGMGSLQAAARGVVSLFAPLQKSGELFGFWGLANQAAFMIGPFLFGLIASVGSQKVAVGVTGVWFVLGWIGMLFIDEGKGRRAAAEWTESEAAAVD